MIDEWSVGDNCKLPFTMAHKMATVVERTNHVRPPEKDHHRVSGGIEHRAKETIVSTNHGCLLHLLTLRLRLGNDSVRCPTDADSDTDMYSERESVCRT